MAPPARRRSFAVCVHGVACLSACTHSPPTPQQSTAVASDAAPSAMPDQALTRLPSLMASGYYLGVCAQCNGPLGAKGEAIECEIRARPVRFCCSACESAFIQDMPASFERLDALMIADQRPHYTLTTSIVSDRPLPSSPLEFIVADRLIRVIDAAERAEFERDAAAYMARLDRALLKSQRPSYGMPDKCPVQGDILPGDVVTDFVIASRMVRVCCLRCERVVRARPYQYLSMVDYARRHPSPQSRIPED